MNSSRTHRFHKMHLLCVCVAATFLALHLAAFAEPKLLPEGYSVQTFETPEDVVMKVGGIDFASDDTAYICTRYGKVLSYKDGEWNLFAQHLQEPLGILVDRNAEQRTVYVAQKPELTALVDTDGDGTAEQYRTIADEWGLSRDYHEYAYGPVRDSKGNFYVMLNLSSTMGPRVGGSSMSHNAPYRGWLMKISPQGKVTPYAYGFRSAMGLEITPDDSIVVTDGQGDWLPTSNLHVVKKGAFHGHPASLMDLPEFKDKNLNDVPSKKFKQMRRRPAVWFPYGAAGHHPGEPVYYTDEHQFGPFQGQFFVGDQSRGNVMRVSLQNVKGKYQGAVINFVDRLQSGIARAEFGPDGRSIWVGQIDRGWEASGKNQNGLQRIVYDGETIPFTIKTIRARSYGFELFYTHPIDREKALNPNNYTMKHWTYNYHASYGSDKKDVTKITPQKINVSSSRRRVQLKLENMPNPRVYMIKADVPGADGTSPAPDTGYYTLNRVP